MDGSVQSTHKLNVQEETSKNPSAPLFKFSTHVYYSIRSLHPIINLQKVNPSINNHPYISESRVVRRSLLLHAQEVVPNTDDNQGDNQKANHENGKQN